MRPAKYVVVIIFTILLLFPLWWMLQGSFMNVLGLMKVPPNFIPKNLTLANYKLIFQNWYLGDATIPRWFLNSMIIASISVSITIFITALAAHGFSFYEFRLKKAIFWVYVMSMMLPGYAIIIPRFVLIKNLGLLNTWMGIILPSVFGAVGVFLFKNYADTLSRAFVDGARMDGASELRILIQIVIPLCKPIILVLAILGFMGELQNFLWPSLVMSNMKRQPLIVGIIFIIQNVRGFEGTSNDQLGLGLAGGVILLIPLLVIFVTFQRHFRGSVIQGGIK